MNSIQWQSHYGFSSKGTGGHDEISTLNKVHCQEVTEDRMEKKSCTEQPTRKLM